MAQLVQLLGSVVHQPDLLVLDEPFSGLDPVNQERLEALILAERDRGATILFSTHVMAHAERLCDRLAIIAGGKRRFEGTVDDARGMLPQPRPLRAARTPMPAIAAAAARRCGRADGRRLALPAAGRGDRGVARDADRRGLRHRRPVDRAARAARRVRPDRRRSSRRAQETRHEPVPPHAPPDADDRAPRFRRDGVHARSSCCSCSRPCIMGSFGAIGGLGAASVADGAPDKARIVAIVPDATRAADDGGGHAAARAVPPRRRGAARARRSRARPPIPPRRRARRSTTQGLRRVARCSTARSTAPQILYGPRGSRAADYLGAARRRRRCAAERLGGTLPPITATKTPIDAPTRLDRRATHQSAFFAVFGIFFLTLFLAGQVVGTMAEERNNKVIEVLAAAVPLESVFFGKLIGMFGVAVLFVAFWGTSSAQLGIAAAAERRRRRSAISAPAVGMPAFVAAVRRLFHDGLSAARRRCSSASARRRRRCARSRCCRCRSRSLQVAMFGAGAPRRRRARTAGSRPPPRCSRCRSPFAMAGRAANSPELWPHVAALAWQVLWVTIFITRRRAAVPPRRAAVGQRQAVLEAPGGLIASPGNGCRRASRTDGRARRRKNNSADDALVIAPTSPRHTLEPR